MTANEPMRIGNIDLETLKLVKDAMKSGVSKEDFKKFLETKKMEKATKQQKGDLE